MSRPTPRQIHVHIDRLVLGPEFAGVDPEALQRAVTAELERQLGHPAVPRPGEEGLGMHSPGPVTMGLGRRVAREVLRGGLEEALAP